MTGVALVTPAGSGQANNPSLRVNSEGLWQKKNNEENNICSLFPVEKSTLPLRVTFILILPCDSMGWHCTLLMCNIMKLSEIQSCFTHGCQTASCRRAKTSKTAFTPCLHQCSVITVDTAKLGWGLCKNKAGPVPSWSWLPHSLLMKGFYLIVVWRWCTGVGLFLLSLL